MCQALSYGGNPVVHRTESCFPGTSLLVRQDTQPRNRHLDSVRAEC